MPNPVSHPFTLDIQMPRHLQGQFQWAIKQRGLIVREGRVTHETFEESRVAGKDALDQTVTLWRRETAPGHAAQVHFRDPSMRQPSRPNPGPTIS